MKELTRSLFEASILSALGGLWGIGLAVWLAGASRGLGPLLPRPVSGSVDPLVVAFALAITAGCGLLFGTAPALHSARAGARRGLPL